ncbi:MAG: sulfotransferase [Burkholderiales bacterium]|nr:sulfotransferase [Burkholderiales bacterium]
MKPGFVAVTGLPRAGSTLLCQMLSMHPEIDCEGQSSPLCNLLLGIRRMASDDQFMLSQLDNSFESGYGHLQDAMTGFLRGWLKADRKIVVDKNRAWLRCIEMVLKLAPEAKFIVCIRDLGQIYGSIEAQHQKTILLDFIDHLADFDRFGRADMLFAKDKVIGAPLISIHAVQDLPKEVLQRIYFLRFEDLMGNPSACMSHLFSWLGVSPLTIDPENIAVNLVQESDSHYRMKYLHALHGSIVKPKRHEIPPRIEAQIRDAFSWYYKLYYPAMPG